MSFLLYLEGTELKLRTDSKPLLNLSTIFKNENSSTYIERRMSQLQIFNFKNEHLSGKSGEIKLRIISVGIRQKYIKRILVLRLGPDWNSISRRSSTGCSEMWAGTGSGGIWSDTGSGGIWSDTGRFSRYQTGTATTKTCWIIGFLCFALMRTCITCSTPVPSLCHVLTALLQFPGWITCFHEFNLFSGFKILKDAIISGLNSASCKLVQVFKLNSLQTSVAAILLNFD